MGDWRSGTGPLANCTDCGQPRPKRLLKDGVCPKCRMPVITTADNPLLTTQHVDPGKEIRGGTDGTT